MKTLLVMLSFVLFTSCASKNVANEVKAEVSHETSKDKKALGHTIHEQIENSKSLSADQKKQLLDLLHANKAKAEKLIEESYQSRAVLIKELFSPTSDAKKVTAIKANIKKIEAARLKNTFDTAEMISKIVGKNAEHSEALTDHLMIFDRPTRGSSK